MSNITEFLQKTPPWVWWSFIPGLGGLALVYAGITRNNPKWIIVGIGLTILSCSLVSYPFFYVLWFFQVYLSFSWRNAYLTSSKPVSKLTGKRTLDINTCSKDEMVKILGLPIVYANHIEALQNEGYILTHLEELSEIAGIPQHHLERISPLIHFCYNPEREHHFSWRRVNVLSKEELIELGFSLDVAVTIVEERTKNGGYQSVMDLKKRTGLPFHVCRQFIPY